MLTKLLMAFSFMAVCIVIHSAGVVAALRRLRRVAPSPQFWPVVWVFIIIAAWIVVLHLSEIAVWALFYAWTKAMPDLQSALYFSVVTYTTTGYGDLVLPKEWRLLAGVEALTGILMCGWSTAFFLTLGGRLYENRDRTSA
jgi:voltage-gated potassium channel Kch